MSERVNALDMALGPLKPERWGGKPPMATCSGCAAPLISTTLWAYYEFVCIECGRHLGFVEPEPAMETAELRTRYEALLEEWDSATDGKDVDEVTEWLVERVAGRG